MRVEEADSVLMESFRWLTYTRPDLASSLLEELRDGQILTAFPTTHRFEAFQGAFVDLNPAPKGFDWEGPVIGGES